MPDTYLPEKIMLALTAAAFSYRSSTLIARDQQVTVYEREHRGFLQRLTYYAAIPTPWVAPRATMKTLCSTAPEQCTVYEAEHLMCLEPECVELLLCIADVQLEQFQLSGGASFFEVEASRTPRYDLRQPLILCAP